MGGKPSKGTAKDRRLKSTRRLFGRSRRRGAGKKVKR
jgi:hypothetical protein